ncbi:MAG: hypothetical protein CMI31_15715 [Opitutae bacterium]|nr:hypothetical protein [Opitutae bacterium]
MASPKPTQAVLSSIRRNTCYSSARTILLVSSVILALLALVTGTSLFSLLDKEDPMAVLLSASVVLGGGLLAFLVNCLGNVYLDAADALLQIAKFEERGNRSRNEALELARKAVEDDEDEEVAPQEKNEPERKPASPTEAKEDESADETDEEDD